MKTNSNIWRTIIGIVLAVLMIFAALKYNHPYARMRYSDYCLYSAQTRYENLSAARKQMYKVHQPHKQSGYLEEIQFEKGVDGFRMDVISVISKDMDYPNADTDDFGAIIENNYANGSRIHEFLQEMNREVLSETSIPLEIVLQDSYLAHMVGNPDFSFPKTEQFELASFKEGLKHQFNQSIGDELVEAIYVSGVNFIGITESRSKQTLKSIWIQEQTSAFDKLPKANK